MPHILIVVIVGILTGFANGLFGAGGGTIVVIAMERLLKMDTHKAHSTSIAVILPLSIISAFIYLRKDFIDWQAVLYVSTGGVTGGFIGAKLLPKVQGEWLHKIFGLFMIIAALRMIL